MGMGLLSGPVLPSGSAGASHLAVGAVIGIIVVVIAVSFLVKRRLRKNDKRDLMKQMNKDSNVHLDLSAVNPKFVPQISSVVDDYDDDEVGGEGGGLPIWQIRTQYFSEDPREMTASMM
jgi:hypothetical protein